MALTGLQYYYDQLGLNYNAISAYFDFNSGNNFISGGSSLFVKSPAWCPAATGQVIGNTGNFLNYSGSGNFTGNYIRINNYSNSRNFVNWATMGIVDISGDPYNRILFSCFPSGQTNSSAAYSGFFCGINGANKLFFSHHNFVDGPQVYTYSGQLPSKFIFVASRQNSNLILGVYNPTNAGFDYQSFQIFNNTFTIDNDWYIGGAPTNPIYYPNLKNFSGAIDEFLLISGNLFNNFLDVLPSGFWSAPSGIVSGIQVFSGGAGFTTGVPFPYLDITGYQSVLTGSSVDACGNIENIYANIPLTGVVTGIQYITITGNQTFTGITGSYLQFYSDIGFVNSLGYEAITSFYEIYNGNDVLEYFANIPKTISDISLNNTNNIPLFSNINNGWNVNNLYSEKNIPVYNNGQLQLESGFFAYQDGYSLNYLLSGDYFLTGRKIESTGFYTSTDLMVYDYNPNISGNSWRAKFYSGSISGNFVPFENLNSFQSNFIYLNGQKLTTGVNISGSGIIYYGLLMPWNLIDDLWMNYYVLWNSDNLFITGENTFQYIYLSGLGSNAPDYSKVIFDSNYLISSGKFLRNTSTVFFNGIRQHISYDYIECGKFDLLSGLFVDSLGLVTLYNNNNDFFENITGLL